MSQLDGKIAIVTGASSGIGRAIALSFVAEGARVVIADITEEPLEGGAPTRELAGEACTFERVDVAVWEDVDKLVTRTVERFGRLDIMVNNAAIFSGTALVDTSNEQWDRVMAVNMTGMFYGCKRAVAQMREQTPVAEVRGRVINLGSQQGIVTSPRDTAYGVSKAGAIYITRQIAVDYARDLIVCNSISPGKIVTGKPGSSDGSGAARECPPPHALAATGSAGGHRQRRSVPRQRPGDVHHGRKHRRGRRLARGLSSRDHGVAFFEPETATGCRGGSLLYDSMTYANDCEYAARQN